MAEPLYPLLVIDRLRMETDGDGVTTLVAGAGCPLSCRYCLNKDVLTRGAEQVSARELFERLKIDDLYFRATGGGVTFGGGESLLHAGFISRFRELCPPEWKVRAETSLAVPPELLEEALTSVDGFIVDCKDMDPELYRRYTGGDAALMQRNLKRLLEAAGPERVTVRVPLIPEFNTPEDRERSAERLRAMGVTRLDLFEYVKR